MEKFRWAYIGCGNIAKVTSKQILASGKHEIASVYSRNFEHASDFAKKINATAFNSLEEAVNRDDIDGVYIASVHTAHLSQATECLSYKKPVLCEKPLCVNTADVDRLILSAKENDTFLAEAMWTWYSLVALKVKEWITDGRIGEIKEVKAAYSFPGILMNKNSRVLTPSTAGGSLLDVGVYPITYCYNLFGSPEEIKCKGKLKDGIDIGEEVVLHYNNFDCKMKISLTGLNEYFKIYGTKGKIFIPMFHMALNAKLKSDSFNESFSGKTNYDIEFSRVAEEIRSGKKQSDFVPLSSTRNCMLIMDECRKQMGLVYPFEK